MSLNETIPVSTSSANGNSATVVSSSSNGNSVKPSPSPSANPSYRSHGTGVRGAELLYKSSISTGRFGRMFRTLPAANFSPSALQELGKLMTAKHEDQQTPETEVDDEENPGIMAGYTYLGQFIDHDLTFDPASSLQRANDPDAITNFRTPSFDLDSLYGRGPDDQPYLYADDGLHMLLGQKIGGSEFDPNTRDLPRNNPNPGEPARALIGDPRNDENTIVSQLHSTMLRFHNRIADYLTQCDGHPPKFEHVQRLVRWHYQWVILHDFLPTMIGRTTLKTILPQLANDQPVTAFTPDLKFFQWSNSPFIPVEFSVAAYRFGHSMIRPIYRLNTTIADRQLIFPEPNGDTSKGLTGFKVVADDRAVDWTLFFNIEERPHLGSTRTQPSYKIDSSLVNPLGTLPASVASGIPSLAARNLLRSLRMGMPSGQAVARYMGMPVIPDDKLRVGKAIESDASSNPRLIDISPEFRNNAPLWYYILAEAQQVFVDNNTPIHLGPVGGRIVGEVFIGLLFGDNYSYVSQHPCWQPIADFCRDGKFGIAELILQAKESV